MLSLLPSYLLTVIFRGLLAKIDESLKSKKLNVNSSLEAICALVILELTDHLIFGTVIDLLRKQFSTELSSVSVSTLVHLAAVVNSKKIHLPDDLFHQMRKWLQLKARFVSLNIIHLKLFLFQYVSWSNAQRRISNNKDYLILKPLRIRFVQQITSVVIAIVLWGVYHKKHFSEITEAKDIVSVIAFWNKNDIWLNMFVEKAKSCISLMSCSELLSMMSSLARSSSRPYHVLSLICNTFDQNKKNLAVIIISKHI